LAESPAETEGLRAYNVKLKKTGSVKIAGFFIFSSGLAACAGERIRARLMARAGASPVNYL
jgi:hypothetical protein